MNDYEWTLNKVKASINEKQKAQNSLLDKDIESAIHSVKDLIKEILDSNNSDSEIFKAVKNHFFNGYEYHGITLKDWERIERDVKSIYCSTLEAGFGITEGDVNRNTSWWSDDYQYKKTNFYWNRYKNVLNEKLGLEVVRTTDRDTNFVLNNIGNPKEGQFSIHGMVVGHVQSGKTANFSGVLCKAADAGYKFIVVISGDKINLRDQTQERVDESFVGIDLEGKNDDRKPVPLTQVGLDFSIDKARSFAGVQSGAFRNPVVLVVKKNASILNNLLVWLKEDIQNFSDTSVLVIDDESDYASVNTKEEEDPTSINSKIRELLLLSRKTSYVAYTATPFANIFIDHHINHKELGQDLFPKDFIYALNAPTNYFGSEAFLMNGKEDLYWREINDYADLIPIKHKKDDSLFELPESLYKAIRCFILTVVIRSLRGQEEQHKSMLIHITRFTIKHSEVADLVGEYLEIIEENIKAYSMIEEDPNGHITALRETFEDEFLSKADDKNLDSEFDWSEVKSNLPKYVETLKIREEHQHSVARVKYDSQDPINVIVIGGLSLSRGFTVEGLTISYFLRGTLFYDTLMQMARWYGYRTGYQDLCRVYMTETMLGHYQHIHESTVELIGRLKEMQSQGRTPKDFGLAVVQHPDNVIKVTAIGKMRRAETRHVSMRLDGQLKETARLSLNQDALDENFATIEKIICDLMKGCSAEKAPKAGSGYLWKDVAQELVCSFLKDFKVYDSGGFGEKSRMPIIFVREFASKNKKWDVALYSGEGDEIEISGIKLNKEKRKINEKREEGYIEFDRRNISSGTQEYISVPKEYRSTIESREEARNYPKRNNLLMLHIAQQSNENNNDYQNVPCFGVSLSGNGISKDKTVEVLMNTRMQEEVKEVIAINSEAEE